MVASIRRFFHIQPGEARLTFLLFALLFLLGIAFNFVETSLCGRIGSERAAGLLLSFLDHPNDTIRGEALQALAHAGYQVADPPAAESVRQAITQEVHHAAWLLAGMRDLVAEPQLAYLRQVLTAAVDEARRRFAPPGSRILHRVAGN